MLVISSSGDNGVSGRSDTRLSRGAAGAGLREEIGVRLTYEIIGLVSV